LVLFLGVKWEEEKKNVSQRLSTTTSRMSVSSTASSMTLEGMTNTTEPLLQDEQLVNEIL
jgi:hypothetical protein